MKIIPVKFIVGLSIICLIIFPILFYIVSFLLFYILSIGNSIVPYYPNELSSCEMKSSNVKRIINMLEEKDKKQLLNIMGVEDIEKLGD